MPRHSCAGSQEGSCTSAVNNLSSGCVRARASSPDVASVTSLRMKPSNGVTLSSSQGKSLSKGTCGVCQGSFRIQLDGRIYRHGGKATGSNCSGSLSVPISFSDVAPLVLSSGCLSQPVPSFPVPECPVSSDTSENQSISGLSAISQLHQRIQLGLPATVDHVPKGARHECSISLVTFLRRILDDPSCSDHWANLFAFAPSVLAKPSRGGQAGNLTKLCKNRASTFSGVSCIQAPAPVRVSKAKDQESNIAKLVSSKMEQGNFKAAVRIACSDESLAPNNSETLDSLFDKHPATPADRRLVQDSLASNLFVSSTDVHKAIKSFPCGSAGGPDGFKPQHLKDLTSDFTSSGALLAQITDFINLLFSGRCPEDVRPLLFGGSLTALTKKDGGIRPIAVGWVFRRLAAKCANSFASGAVADYLAPRQLGVGVRGGAEAAAHAARKYVQASSGDSVMIKLDFKNAFNTIRRDCMLETVRDKVPEIFNFCKLAYGDFSYLFFRGSKILSQEGCQQGDPLGPLLFSLTIHPILESLRSDLILGYLDDLTLGGSLQVVQSDYATIRRMSSDMGLILNEAKCECVTDSHSVPPETLRDTFPGFLLVDPVDSELLGAPLFVGRHLDEALEKKVSDLKRAASRLPKLQAHDGLLILKNALSAPKLIYILRTSPCSGNQALQEFDATLRISLTAITNCSLSDMAWTQATLPVAKGGLGIRSVAALAPSAYLASAAATLNLQLRLLPSDFNDPELDRALAIWSSCLTQPTPPVLLNAMRQAAWDAPVVAEAVDSISRLIQDPYHMARWKAAMDSHSGDWLKALPISAIGLRLDDEAVRIAVGIRLGSNLCTPHPCACGELVDARGTHGLACRHNKGRLIRHSLLNDIVHRTLTKAGIPAIKEPAGLLRTDKKRPDGCSLIPWQGGKCVAWDVTAPDTLARSHLSATSLTTAAAAETASKNKMVKYIDISRTHLFVPIAVESLGPINSAGVDFLCTLGKRLSNKSGDPRETSFLFQRISIINQRMNAAAITGCFPAADVDPADS